LFAATPTRILLDRLAPFATGTLRGSDVQAGSLQSNCGEAPEVRVVAIPGVDIGRATEVDLDGIMELQAANQPERGGMLSASLSRSRVAGMMRGRPLIVARRGGRVVAFLMTSTREMNADVPVIRAMLDAYPGTADAYVYGPVCVQEEERGRGLAQAMFAELRRLERGREGILFIRRDNPASLHAHTRMGMREVAGFVFDGVDYAVLSYVG
jgi:predicted GNAT superfamily acetyltransferase